MLREIRDRLRVIMDDEPDGSCPSQPKQLFSNIRAVVVTSPLTGTPFLWVQEPRGDSYIEKLVCLPEMGGSPNG
jgi:hypothetical protein